MFLLSSADFASASALRRSGELDGTTEKNSPEPDSLLLMDGILDQFDPAQEHFTYDPLLSQVPVESGSSTLRAVGGATFRALRERQPLGVALGVAPLLDGLAQNLLRRALNDGPTISTVGSLERPRRSILGFREPREELSLYELFAELNRLSNWRDRSLQSGGTIREWKCGVRLQRHWVVLSVRALVNGSGVPFQIESMELSPSNSISEHTQLKIGKSVTAALEDQKRRLQLADLYRKAPMAPALPAELRSKLKSALADMGIPNGSYSREGFSLGRFPYGRTVAPIKSRRTQATDLIFKRCECGAVESVSLLGCNEEQKRFFRNFSKGQIQPWHRSICPRREYSYDYEYEMDSLDSLFVGDWTGI